MSWQSRAHPPDVLNTGKRKCRLLRKKVVALLERLKEIVGRVMGENDKKGTTQLKSHSPGPLSKTQAVGTTKMARMGSKTLGTGNTSSIENIRVGGGLGGLDKKS